VTRCTSHLFFLEGIKHLCKWRIEPFKLWSMCILMKMKTFFMIVIKISQFGSFFVWYVSFLGHKLCELVQTLATIVLTHSYKKSYSNHNKEKCCSSPYLLTYNLASLSGPNSTRARAQLTLSLIKQFRSNRLTLY